MSCQDHFFSYILKRVGIELFKSCLSMIKELLKTNTCMIHSLDLFRMPSSLKKGASNGSYRSLYSDFLFARVIRVIVLWRVRFRLRLPLRNHRINHSGRYKSMGFDFL